RSCWPDWSSPAFCASASSAVATLFVPANMPSPMTSMRPALMERGAQPRPSLSSALLVPARHTPFSQTCTPESGAQSASVEQVTSHICAGPPVPHFGSETMHATPGTSGHALSSPHAAVHTLQRHESLPPHVSLAPFGSHAVKKCVSPPTGSTREESQP